MILDLIKGRWMLWRTAWWSARIIAQHIRQYPLKWQQSSHNFGIGHDFQFWTSNGFFFFKLERSTHHPLYWGWCSRLYIYLTYRVWFLKARKESYRHAVDALRRHGT